MRAQVYGPVDGRILIVGRDGKIGVIKRESSVKLWEKLPSPAVAVSPLNNEGVADGTIISFSSKVSYF